MRGGLGSGAGGVGAARRLSAGEGLKQLPVFFPFVPAGGWVPLPGRGGGFAGGGVESIECDGNFHRDQRKADTGVATYIARQFGVGTIRSWNRECLDGAAAGNVGHHLDMRLSGADVYGCLNDISLDELETAPKNGLDYFDGYRGCRYVLCEADSQMIRARRSGRRVDSLDRQMESGLKIALLKRLK